MTGTIASWSGADRCRLLVWMLGRETAVEVHGGRYQRVGVVARLRRTMRGVPMPASGNSQTTGLADQSHDF